MIIAKRKAKFTKGSILITYYQRRLVAWTTGRSRPYIKLKERNI